MNILSTCLLVSCFQFTLPFTSEYKVNDKSLINNNQKCCTDNYHVKKNSRFFRKRNTSNLFLNNDINEGPAGFGGSGGFGGSDRNFYSPSRNNPSPMFGD